MEVFSYHLWWNSVWKCMHTPSLMMTKTTFKAHECHYHTSKTSLCLCFLKWKWPTNVMSGNCVCVSPQWKTHRDNCIQWNLQPQPFARWQWIFSSNRRRSTWYLSSMISNSEKEKNKKHKNLELRSFWCLSSMISSTENKTQKHKTTKNLNLFLSAVVCSVYIPISAFCFDQESEMVVSIRSNACAGWRRRRRCTPNPEITSTPLTSSRRNPMQTRKKKKKKKKKNIFSGRMWSIYKSDRITKPPEWLENLGRFVSTKIFSIEKDLQMDTEEMGIL